MIMNMCLVRAEEKTCTDAMGKTPRDVWLANTVVSHDNCDSMTYTVVSRNNNDSLTSTVVTHNNCASGIGVSTKWLNSYSTVCCLVVTSDVTATQLRLVRQNVTSCNI